MGLKGRIIKESKISYLSSQLSTDNYPILTIVAIVTKRTALAIIAILITPVCASAQQTQFQRIRTFDPTTGRYVTPASAPSSRYVPANQQILTPPTNAPVPRASPRNVPTATVTTTTTTLITPPATPSKPAPSNLGDDNVQPQDESDANNLAPLSQPSTMPPDTLSRPPLPTANESLVLPQLSNPTIRPSLSWRSKAYKLSLETYDAQNNGKHPNLMMNGSMQDSLNALVQACQTNGLQIIGQSLPAGQLGARLIDATAGRSLFVFVLKKVADDKTIVKACVEPDSKGKKLILLGDLLNQAASLVDGKGLL
jgi:hypothetical protein